VVRLQSNQKRSHMWDEIADMPGEIFDLTDEDREEMSKEFDKPVEQCENYWEGFVA